MYRKSEWQEARDEKIADWQAFNRNEAAIEEARFNRENADEARKARLAKFAAEIEKMEGGK